MTENGVWWLGSGENRRRDDEEAAPVENEEMNEEERAQPDFDWETMVDEAALQGESGSGEKFSDGEDEVQGSGRSYKGAYTNFSSTERDRSFRSRPSPQPKHTRFGFVSLQVDFERARVDRIQADLERAQA
ncbi:hypothetical protein Dimus_030111 [Dionaea muscipula]